MLDSGPEYVFGSTEGLDSETLSRVQKTITRIVRLVVVVVVRLVVVVVVVVLAGDLVVRRPSVR